MAIGTYAELQSAITAWTNRSDLTAVIPDFVALAEADMNKRLRSPHNETRDTAFSVSSRFTALPGAFAEMRRVMLLTNPREELRPLPSVMSGGYYEAGRPRYYAINGNELEVVPISSGSTLELTYWRTVLPLASNSTTAVLTNHPDVYLFGSCLQAALYLDDAAMASRFQPMYEAALERANSVSNRQLGSGLAVMVG